MEWKSSPSILTPTRQPKVTKIASEEFLNMDYPQERFVSTTFAPGSFWARRREVVRIQTLRHQLHMLKETGRYDAFKLKWHPIYAKPPTVWPVPDHQFWDSDVAKWIEGACYLLMDHFDPEIDVAVKELVQMIRDAQHPDGYLNIHYSVVEPGKRFTNLRDMHELYNLLATTFGGRKGQIPGYPGHPEIELALLRLYKVTANPEHLQLARFFIEERGNPNGGEEKRHYYDVEAEARGEKDHEMPLPFPAPRSYWYQQAQVPIVEQDTIEGHSVRAMYLLTAVADLVQISGPNSEVGAKFLPALHLLWSNMVEKKMYVTGGIGAIKKWEGFGVDYFLPHGTDEGGCYSETCAAIGVMMLAERLLQFELNSQYSDIMELCIYNAVLTGMNLDGKAFTYVNQLASSDEDLSQRHEWFECACCPPNVTRTLGFMGGYLWNHTIQGQSVVCNVHLYTSATLDIKVSESAVRVVQKTNWPWAGDVDFAVEVEGPLVNVELRLRIPGWAKTWEINPQPAKMDVRDGYLFLDSKWVHKHSRFRLSCPMNPRVAYPNPLAMQSVAYIMRGPIVYCVEDVDHPGEQHHFKVGANNPVLFSMENHAESVKTENYFQSKCVFARRITV
ncbi:Six-hairpin glycosidase [Penicillium macrosclerotiorum]|uniref:Six-hairpin glycosidase n=1 Tax=Penicillium macrosclerotiorum TaxID=303699 RepID=UPI0025469F72|nr:Six-hairpin glycosidase [Penicillium macrosclerotiorum]KAJ5689756.1 Six-hairpin glycosidase [Penicillium macrosclerotiorum]